MGAFLLRSSIDISLIIQWVVLLIGVVATSVGPSGPLRVVLTMENVVQAIELVFYHWYRWVMVGSVAIASGAVDLAWVRYLDWVITTPVMLVSTALFFEWQRWGTVIHDDNTGLQDVKDFSLWDWLSENQTSVWAMVLANGVMLLVGFLQEIGVLDIVTSTVTGFIALGVSFWVLGQMREHKKTIRGKGNWLYPFMFGVWSLYGVAAILPSLPKNIMYNVLDLFSKNFYGVYVSSLILSR